MFKMPSVNLHSEQSLPRLKTQGEGRILKTVMQAEISGYETEGVLSECFCVYSLGETLFIV